MLMRASECRAFYQADPLSLTHTHERVDLANDPTRPLGGRAGGAGRGACLLFMPGALALYL